MVAYVVGVKVLSIRGDRCFVVFFFFWFCFHDVVGKVPWYTSPEKISLSLVIQKITLPLSLYCV